MKDLADKIKVNIHKGLHLGVLQNKDLVEIIELCGNYLNLKTVSDYKRDNNISYQGARKDTKTRRNIVLFDTKYIIDNY